MSKLGHIDIGPLDAREERLVATAIQQLSAIPTRGPAHAVFDALGTCAYCTQLRRSEVGNHALTVAHPIDSLPKPLTE